MKTFNFQNLVLNLTLEPGSEELMLANYSPQSFNRLMPYRYIKRISDSPYFHVFNRGSDKKAIFLSQTDYLRFASKMEELSRLEGVKVLAYCLMKNHYHLLLREVSEADIARFMKRLNGSHALYFNLKYKHSGHLFQGPYQDRPVTDKAYLLQVSAYIHNNPWVLGVDPESYRWSSYSSYLSGMSSWVSKDDVLNLFDEINKPEAYRSFVDSRQNLVLNLKPEPGSVMIGVQ